MTDEENGWFSGAILSAQFPPKLKEALDRYDDVVEHQMLSLLDDALAAVEEFGLALRYPDGTLRKVFSLHVNSDLEASFRITPVPPPAWLSKSESA